MSSLTQHFEIVETFFIHSDRCVRINNKCWCTHHKISISHNDNKIKAVSEFYALDTCRLLYISFKGDVPDVPAVSHRDNCIPSIPSSHLVGGPLLQQVLVAGGAGAHGAERVLGPRARRPRVLLAEDREVRLLVLEPDTALLLRDTQLPRRLEILDHISSRLCSQREQAKHAKRHIV